MAQERAKQAKQIKALMPGEGNLFLTVNEVAEYLNVKADTVYKWLGNGPDHLNAVRVGPGNYAIRIPPDELVRFLTRRVWTKGRGKL
ncbi:MAG: helix-turn-helix domain-containing protein [Dehalococcoidia bacterium]